MNTLNDIPPYLRDAESSRWTSRGGLMRGLIWTLVVAAVMTAILVLVEWQEPGVTIIKAEEVGGAYRGYSRTVFLSLVIGVVVTRFLFGTMHRASGMVGISGTYVVCLSILVIASKHIVFAINGVELQSGFSKGWVWLHPQTIFLRNFAAWIGIGLALLLFKDGSSLRDYLSSWFKRFT